jgi:mevalonate kinase
LLEDKNFSAKILLFGEYSVIRKSNALAIPYSLFDGKLIFPKEKKRGVDNELSTFAKYIKRLQDKDELNFGFDVNSFGFDVSGGLIFDSSIPQGYGVGSSGALCAAILSQYGKLNEDQNKDISFLKKCFSVLESHFHGSSSGVDPLISYLNSPILIGDGELTKVEVPTYSEGEGAVFLLNTGRARRTEPLVNLFLEKCSSKDFAYLCDRVLSPISNACIDHFLSGDTDSLLEKFKELSIFQFEHFSAMIPKLYNEMWEEGIESGDYYLKLCGAGGGGFILGITKNLSKLPAEFSNQEVRPLFRF